MSTARAANVGNISARATTLAALASTATTLVLALVPDIHPSYHAPQLKGMLQITIALVGALAALLVVGRFQKSRQLSDLVLALALSLFAGGAATFGVWRAVAATGNASGWAALSTATLGAVLFSAGAWTPSARLRPRSPLTYAAAAAVPAVIAVVGIVMWAVRDSLPGRFSGSATVAPGNTDVVFGAAFAVELVATCAALAAAAGFLRRTRASEDELLGWFAVGSTLAAFAYLNYALFSSPVSQSLRAGDLFILLAAVMFLLGGVREVTFYWRDVARAAVTEERRRIARDLHDRLGQELAFIGRNARLAREEADVARIARAADRALEESRRIMHTLSGSDDEPLALALANETSLIAHRDGLHVDLDLDETIEVGADRREAFVRIACEAVSNAARHSCASTIRVELHRASTGVRLRVTDDGIGFSLPSEGHALNGGFGLVSMRERAQALGGEFRLQTMPGEGTEVEALL